MLPKHFEGHALEKRGIITEDAMTEWLICRQQVSKKTMVELGYVILFEPRDAFPQLSLLLAAELLNI